MAVERRKMSEFVERERKRQADFRARSSHFSEEAKAGNGKFRGHEYACCLPAGHEQENLFAGIRVAAISYFSEHGIQWHQGWNHMCSSQVFCANFMFPFADKPTALAKLLQPLFPGIRRVLPMEADGRFVSLEWFGLENYLQERVRSGRTRTRGACTTCPDAAVMFEDRDGTKEIVLIEWKYTESYPSISLVFSARGTDRREIYAPLFNDEVCPIDKAVLPSYDALFFEPFYQLFREQLLASQMEKARELGSERVSLMHVAPAENLGVEVVTSPELRQLGSCVTEVWQTLLRTPGRFVGVKVESLFKSFPQDDFPELGEWSAYMRERYTWLG